ncbi:MAG: RNA polymerase sigma-70 factor [Tannerellaceae bacterium]|jgi:RNA polymerase sigma-70 factor (ECF subfamily)|nr:RNA polymerase sigma-70 factor [Tannerellaceae bacterium]
MNKNISDQHISIGKIQSGDIGEFERLFHLYYKRMCIYSESMIRNSREAEDIVCNIFARLWENREELNIKTSLEAYLVSTIHHHSINYLKHIRIEDKYWEEAQYRLKHSDMLFPEDSSNPLTVVITNEVNESIEKSIASLPPQCREVFLLNKYDGLSYNEIAQKLDISINTVRTQITRAMRKMRDSLSQHL